jgi:tetratricopeptide (TPR) repeat protein
MAWAYQGLGTVLMKKGQMQSAIESFSRALELESKIVWAYFNRAHCYPV